MKPRKRAYPCDWDLVFGIPVLIKTEVSKVSRTKSSARGVFVSFFL